MIRLRATPARLSIAGAFVLAIAVAIWSPWRPPYTLNYTESLPLGIYRVRPVDGPFRHEDRVVVCPPREIARLMLERNYVTTGSCPGGVASMLKLVAAVPGDAIDVRARGVYVNGVPLPNSYFATRDFAGRVLPRVPPGHIVVPPGMLWLWTPHVMSFDSRYYGLVPARNVVSLASMSVPLWPWPYEGQLPPEPR